MKHFVITLLCWLGAQLCLGQDLSNDFKYWGITGLNLRFNKKNSFKASHLASYDQQRQAVTFGQTNLTFKRRISENWTTTGGYAYSYIKGRRTTITYHRVSVNLAHQVRFNRLKMTNTVQLEKYFPTLRKFGSRGVITNKWSYSNRSWPLKLSPYIKQQLYYYQGGEPINYGIPEEDLEEFEPEDEDDEPEELEQSPNGFHRYRITGGVRMKLAKPLALSLFYTRQIEFNTGFAPYREINVPRPGRTRIQQPFNNYSLIGVSLTYTLKLY